MNGLWRQDYMTKAGIVQRVKLEHSLNPRTTEKCPILSRDALYVEAMKTLPEEGAHVTVTRI